MLHKASSSKSMNTTQNDPKACHIQHKSGKAECYKGTEYVSEKEDIHSQLLLKMLS